MSVARLAAGGAACCALFVALCGKLGADPGELTTTLRDQTRVNVTIYNGDLSLVHDRRRINLAAGENRLAWRDVSAGLDATSALVESVGTSDVDVFEQNFDFDLLSPAALTGKSVGTTVTVVHRRPLPGQPQRERAKVLSISDGLVLQYADRIETALQDDSYVTYETLPPNLRDKPTLVLGLDDRRAGAQEVELSYLTSGLGWRADYVGQVSSDGRRLDLVGLVTLTNTSGAEYRDAHVQLVAGNVNAPAQPKLGMESATAAADSYSIKTRQENFFEYHLYTLGRPTTIAENQTKQVGLMRARRIPLHESLELRGSANYYSGADADLGERLPVGAFVGFDNKGGELGVPLPGGTVRLYKTDSRGISQFLGADTIEHTPKNEAVRLHLGDSFDVTARKKQTNFHIVSPVIFDSSYQIVLGNAKEQPVDVLVVEPIPADWHVLSENRPHEKSSSSTATWRVHVPAGGHATLTYSVRVRFE